MDGKWVTQEFTDEEMHKFLDRVAEFDKHAMEVAVKKTGELRNAGIISEENEFNVTLALFDKLSLNTFSVVHNQAQNMRS